MSHYYTNIYVFVNISLFFQADISKYPSPGEVVKTLRGFLEKEAFGIDGSGASGDIKGSVDDFSHLLLDGLYGCFFVRPLFVESLCFWAFAEFSHGFAFNTAASVEAAVDSVNAYSRHFIEQPMVGYCSLDGFSPATRASMAALSSWRVTFSGSCQLSSMRPW